MNAACRFEHVTKRFDARDAVRDLDLVVPKGSVFGLLGPNGAGKTTSIRMLMTILRPDSGTIQVLGERPSPRTKDRIGYLPEERGLYRSMRVLDNLLFFASIHGVRTDVAKKRAGEWLERTRMLHTASMRLQELSKGNQQKIQFIATVLHEPELLVLDEPFSGLDPVNQEELRVIVRELAAAGTTLVLSTHLMDEVERLCSHLTLLHQGRAILAGSLDEVRRAHGGSVCRLDFRGDPAFIDSLPGVLASTRVGNTLEVRLEAACEPATLLSQVASQLAVHRFEVRAASLHSIFMRLVAPAASSEPSATVEPMEVAS